MEWNARDAPGEHAGSLRAEQQLSHQALTRRKRPHAEGRLATLLPRSNSSSKVPQAVSSPSGPPVPPAEQTAAKDRLVHGGPAGRQQLATPPSSSAAEPPFEAPWRARPCCRRIKEDMILSQPGASSAEPSGLLPGPCTHRRSWPPPATGAREGEEVIGLHHASIPSASPNENDVALSRHCAGYHPHQPGRCAGGRLSCLCAPRRRAERRVNMLPTPLRAHS